MYWFASISSANMLTGRFVTLSAMNLSKLNMLSISIFFIKNAADLHPERNSKKTDVVSLAVNELKIES